MILSGPEQPTGPQSEPQGEAEALHPPTLHSKPPVKYGKTAVLSHLE